MKYVLLMVYISLLSIHSLDAQQPQKMKQTFNAEEAVIIRELGVVIVPKDQSLIIEIVLGNHEAKKSDLQKGDRVLMANGKKVKSVSDLREQYEGAKVGNEFKLGMKRGENLFIAAFDKQSEDELNKSGGGRMVMRMEQADGEQVLPALGLSVSTKNKTVVVSGTLPTLANNFTTFVPKEGDVILSINGQSVSTADEFDETYSDMELGETVTIEFSRDGIKSKETFKKPKPVGRMMMIKK